MVLQKRATFFYRTYIENYSFMQCIQISLETYINIHLYYSSLTKSSLSIKKENKWWYVISTITVLSIMFYIISLSFFSLLIVVSVTRFCAKIKKSIKNKFFGATSIATWFCYVIIVQHILLRPYSEIFLLLV